MTSVPDTALLRPGTRTVRLWGERITGTVSPRAIAVVTVLMAVTLTVAWFSLITGSSEVGSQDLWDVLRGEASDSTTRIITQWRLPRLVFALIAGAALAASGAVFQSLTRNPLGSPDIIGFSSGAYTGALLVATLGISSVYATSIGALFGGLGTGIAVYLLSRRRGTTSLLIIVGIGMSMLLGAVNAYMITRMKLEDALAAASWGAGSLGNITWPQVWIAGVTLILAFPILLALSNTMAAMEMGDDAAVGLGINVEATRLILLITAIVLIAAVTAFAGPIAFVALAAPQLALRMTRAANVQILPAAATGALLMVVSDFIGRVLVPSPGLPVGVVTLAIGGAYLVWLLIGLGQRRTS